jgi:hypothetical protein
MARDPESGSLVLVLHGSADAAHPVVGSEPPVVVEDGAHFLSLTDAEAVDPHLQRFLAAHASLVR